MRFIVLMCKKIFCKRKKNSRS